MVSPLKDEREDFRAFPWRMRPVLHGKGGILQTSERGAGSKLGQENGTLRKAEALKDSTDWKATADKLMQIQKEWKTIGAVPKNIPNPFGNVSSVPATTSFEQKGKNTASQRGRKKENLQKKEQVIEKLKALLETDEEENKQDAVRGLMKEWNEIGFVPFKEKDRIYKAYHETVDQLFKALNMSAARRRLDNFKNNLKNDAKEGGQGLSRERERLVRAYENKRSEIKTYETIWASRTCSSKKGSSLLNEMNKKMEKLKERIEPDWRKDCRHRQGNVCTGRIKDKPFINDLPHPEFYFGCGFFLQVFEFMLRHSMMWRKTGRTRSAETCLTALNSFKRFRKHVDLSYDEVTSGLVQRYESYLKEQGLCRNTSSFYIRQSSALPKWGWGKRPRLPHGIRSGTSTPEWTRPRNGHSGKRTYHESTAWICPALHRQLSPATSSCSVSSPVGCRSWTWPT